jgi:hypothetical protein
MACGYDRGRVTVCAWRVCVRARRRMCVFVTVTGVRVCARVAARVHVFVCEEERIGSTHHTTECIIDISLLYSPPPSPLSIF